MANKKFKTVEWQEELTQIEQNVFRILLNKLPKDYDGKILNFTVDPESQVVSIEYKLAYKGAKLLASALRSLNNKVPEDFPNKDSFKKMLIEESKLYRKIVNRYHRLRKEAENKTEV